MSADALRHGTLAVLIRRERLLVVLRRVEPRARLLTLVDELADAGARIFEITFDADDAAEALDACSRRLHGRNDGPYAVGAGTVRTRQQLRTAKQTGAAFAVAPTLDLELVREAIACRLPFIPGAATPTEADQAWQAGATFVKLFPASSLGPQFVRELRGPLPEVETIPTGGIEPTRARAFLTAGAVAVGLGSALVRADAQTRRALVARIHAEGT